MMRETIAGRGAAVEPVKEVFLGMTASQLAVFAAGAVAGAALFYTGYRYCKSREEKKAEPLFSQGREKMRLLSAREHVSTLDRDNLQAWFAEHRVDEEGIKFLLAFPDERLLRTLGYDLDKSDAVDLEKCLIQAVYDSRDRRIYSLRQIEFDSIDSTLHADLLEHDGLVILDC